MQMFEAVNEMMTAVGPRIDAVQVVAYPDQKTWVLGLTDTVVCDATLDEARELLVLSASIGTPDPAARDIHKLALDYAAQWQANGGYWIGSDPRDAELRLFLDVAVSSLTMAVFVNTLADFAVCLEGWRAILAKSAEAAKADLVAETGGDFIRV